MKTTITNTIELKEAELLKVLTKALKLDDKDTQIQFILEERGDFRDTVTWTVVTGVKITYEEEREL